jgi:hypothetical protein
MMGPSISFERKALFGPGEVDCSYVALVVPDFPLPGRFWDAPILQPSDHPTLEDARRDGKVDVRVGDELAKRPRTTPTVTS